MEKIRIAHVAGGLTNGGVEKVIESYFSHMKREDYELIYISYDTPKPSVQRRFEELGFSIYQVSKKREHPIKSCLEVFAIFRKYRIQIVHSHMSLICFVSNFLGAVSGATVRIAHSHLFFRDHGVQRLIRMVLKWLTVKTSTDYFACSTDAAAYLFGRKMIRRGNTIVLNNAFDIESYEECCSLAEKLPIFQRLTNKTVLGNIGRFTEQKNQGFVLEIFQKYHMKNPDSVLILAGSGPLLDEVKKLVEQKELVDDVIFAGAVDDPRPWYGLMDLFLFPSRYEGLGIVAMEAQAAGLPVLASDAVPGETAVTKTIRFLSLDLSPEMWAEAAEQLLKDGRMNRFQIAEQARCCLKKKGYDIRREAEKLDRFYHTRMEEGYR